MSSYIPEGYQPFLDLYETQQAIELIKVQFAERLSDALHLKRVSAPLFVRPESGLNDNLGGNERPVAFEIPYSGYQAEVVQSLAKWKRYALKRYDFYEGKGLYTDMNAIRRDEVLDNLHSVYVDQWDWELILTEGQRELDFLKETVRKIVLAIIGTQASLKARFSGLPDLIDSEVSFVTAQELEDHWPELTPEEREQAYVREHPTTFIIGIGHRMASGEIHSARAPDYDDWTLNGDLLLWSDILDTAVELSSMGIRVDAETLDKQLTLSGHDARRELPFHRAVLNNEMPQTIGGGIGQSRLCLLLMGKAHIGEVQSSVWDSETLALYQEAGITLL